MAYTSAAAQWGCVKVSSKVVRWVRLSSCPFMASTGHPCQNLVGKLEGEPCRNVSVVGSPLFFSLREL